MNNMFIKYHIGSKDETKVPRLGLGIGLGLALPLILGALVLLAYWRVRRQRRGQDKNDRTDRESIQDIKDPTLFPTESN
jgi:hypothetical protein